VKPRNEVTLLDRYNIKCQCCDCMSFWRWGVLLRWGSAWVGAHWSSTNRRLCINPIPFLTIWVTAPGGNAP
jgi:hypothetical protein